MYPNNLSYPGLSEIINRIGRDYNVPISMLLGEKQISIYTIPIEQKLDSAVKMLEELEPGLWLWYCHPGIDSPEQNTLIHTAPGDIFIEGTVGPHRAEILKTLTSIEVKSIILKKGIKLINYRELWEEK